MITRENLWRTSAVAIILALALASGQASARGVLDAFSEGMTDEAELLDVAHDSLGRVLVAGRFNLVDGQRRSIVARFNADGSIDQGFNPTSCSPRTPAPGITCDIFALAVADDGSIFIAGVEYEGLTQSDPGVPVLAKLTSSGERVAEWSPQFAEQQLTYLNYPKLAIRGSELTIIGLLALDQDRPVVGLRASTQGTGAVLPFRAVLGPLELQIVKGTLDDAGNLYVVRQGSVTRYRAADGMPDPGYVGPSGFGLGNQPRGLPAWIPGANALVVSDSSWTYAFDTAGNVLPGWPIPSHYLYATGADGLYARDCSWSCEASIVRIPIATPQMPVSVTTATDLSGGWVMTVRPQGPAVVINGRPFGSPGLTPRLRVFRSDGELDTRFDGKVGMIARTKALLRDADDMYVSGGFRHVGTLARQDFARWRLGRPDAQWSPQIFGGAAGLARFDDRILFAGDVHSVDGRPTGGILRFNPAGTGAADAWEPAISFNDNWSRVVADVSGGAIVFGPFVDEEFCGGLVRSFAVRFSPGSSCSGDPQFVAGFEYREVVAGGDGWLYALRDSSATNHGLRRVNAATGLEDPAWGQWFARKPLAITSSNSHLYVAFEPDSLNPDLLPVLFRAPRTTGQFEPGWSSGMRARVEHLEHDGGWIYASGSYFANPARFQVRRIDAASGTLDPGWLADTNGQFGGPFSVIGPDTTAFTGDFTQVNGQPRIGIAAYGDDGAIFASSFE